MLKGLILGSLLSLMSILGCGTDSASSSRINPSVQVVRTPSFEDQVAKTTYKVSCDSGTGSAVAIGPRTLVTAAHVVYERPSMVKRDNILIINKLTDFISSVEIGRVDLKEDLAILTSNVDLPFYARTYTFQSRLAWGQEVMACGHPIGVDYPVATSGRIVNPNEKIGEIPTKLLHSAMTFFGNSGGPLFIKTGSEFLLIGVAHMVYSEYPVLSLATQPDVFLRFIEGR